MSRSILKESLELFADDFEPPKAKKKKAVAPQDAPKDAPKDAKEQLSYKKTGIKKQLRNIKRQEEERRRVKKQFKPIEPKPYKEPDHIEDNISFLERLDHLSAPAPETVEKIVTHSRGNLAKNQPKKDDKPVQFSVFTDNDFDTFDETYKLEQDFWKQ